MIPGANSNLSWSEQYRIVAKQWNDANAAAELLEETKSAMLSQLMLKQGDMPVSRAEMIVKASPEWMDFIKSMVEARKEANLLNVKREYVRMKFTEWNSENANKRAEMRL
jgi:hypothetical protein